MNDEGSPPASANTPAEAAGDSRFIIRASNFVKVAVVFIVLGPPIGFLILFYPFYIFFIYSLFAGTGGSVSVVQLIANFVLMLVAGIVFSYFWGGVHAILTGLMVAIGQMTVRSFGTFHAAGVGLAVALMVAYGFISPFSPKFTRSVEPLSTLHIPDFNFVSVLSIVTTIACWAIVSRWLREVE